MKKTLILLICSVSALISFAQTSDWNNGGGNPARNGLANVDGPQKDSLLWQASPAGIFGMPMFIEGNKLVTMRFRSATNAPIVCYDLTTGELLWQKEITGSTGRSLPIGFRNNQVYAVRFTESLHDTLYAFNADDGSRLWTSETTVDPSITASATFASNGDFFIESYFKMNRINHLTGELIWNTPIMPFVLGHGELSVYNNTGYVLEQVSGGYAYVAAIDLANGHKKYSHIINDTHPGGGLPQCPLMVGTDGTIYVQKQGDNITALTDDGSQLNLLWETEIFGNSPFSQMCIGSDGSVFAPSAGTIIKIDPLNGHIINTSEVISTHPDLFQLRLSATQNDIVFATNGESTVYAFSLDLHELWSDNVPDLNTSGAAIGSNGLIAVSGAHTVKVYTSAEFTAISEVINNQWIEYYPNPVIDKLYLHFSNANLISYNYNIYDQTGKVVLSGNLSDEINMIDLSNVSVGIYFLVVGDNVKQTFKVIKN